MRPSPTSRSRVHATFVSRVHATPQPMGPLGPLEDELPSIWSWEFTKWLVKLYPTLVYQGRSSSVLFQLLEAVDAENCRVFTGELDQISQVPESRPPPVNGLSKPIASAAPTQELSCRSPDKCGTRGKQKIRNCKAQSQSNMVESTSSTEMEPQNSLKSKWKHALGMFRIDISGKPHLAESFPGDRSWQGEPVGGPFCVAHNDLVVAERKLTNTR